LLPPNNNSAPTSSQPSGGYETAPAPSDPQSQWAVVDTPQAKGTLTENFFYSVTCVSVSDCWAVGAYATQLFGFHQTLVGHWDGNSWNLVDSPNTDPGVDNILASVTCTSTSDCWAVGGAVTLSRDSVHTLIEHWDGSAWTIVTSPDPTGGFINALN